MQNAPEIQEYPYYKGFCCHLQDETFLKPYCQLAGLSLYKVAGYNVWTRKHPVIGHVNAYLYCPEIVKDFTEFDADELRCWLRHKKIGQVFIFSSLKYPFLINPESDSGTIFFNLTQSEETLWNNLEPRCRKAIRKAVKNNIKININDGNQHFEKWYAIYSGLAENRQFPMQSYKTLLGLMNQGWGKLFTAWCGEHLLGGVFFITLREYCIPLAGGFGSGPEYRQYSPGNLLFWETIKYAKAQGLTFFDFMGATDDPNHGPTKFKQSFGGEFVRIYKYTLDGFVMKKWLFNALTRGKKILTSFGNIQHTISKWKTFVFKPHNKSV
jgi:hypothetical protein